jgi:molecular chaperone DnaJ
MTEKQCYDLLGIYKQATDDEVKQAYRLAAKKWHPDFNIGSKEAEQKFIEITDAYHTILEIREKKKRFSLKKMFVSTTNNSADTEKQTVHIPQKGIDIHYNLEISFEEAILGCKKVISIEKDRRCQCYEQDSHVDYGCPKCQGSGKCRKTVLIEVKVPRGIRNEQTMRIKGKGNVGDVGAENGDIIITVFVSKNKRFYQKGKDLYIKQEITFPEAVLGTTKTIHTLYGNVELAIPPGTQSRTKFCLEGRGIPDLNGEVGDEYVIVSVVVPTVYNTKINVDFLSVVQKKLYDENPLYK